MRVRWTNLEDGYKRPQQTVKVCAIRHTPTGGIGALLAGTWRPIRAGTKFTTKDTHAKDTACGKRKAHTQSGQSYCCMSGC